MIDQLTQIARRMTGLSENEKEMNKQVPMYHSPFINNAEKICTV